MDNYYNNELYHYGVKGMKWGVRKKIQQGVNNYQRRKHYNKDGSLNTAGRIQKAQDQYSTDVAKSIKKYSKERTAAKTKYKSSEKTRADKKQYRKEKWSANKKFVNNYIDDTDRYKVNVKKSYNKGLQDSKFVSDKAFRTNNKQLMKISDRMDKGDSFGKAFTKQVAVNTGRNLVIEALPVIASVSLAYVAKRKNIKAQQKANEHLIRLGQMKRKHVGKGVYRVYHG